jgi:lambda family phage portal protein
LKVVSADRMVHLAHLSRIGQLRGVTRFASVIGRIEDIKDYEESERIAAKVAAMLTGYVKRLAPDGGGYEGPLKDDNGNDLPRQVGLSPGTIIDTLAVGEEIGLIDSKRPNPNLITFRNGQLRAFAAGISASYSSISRNYDGTYSSQRQELVEQWVHYACLTDDFVSMAVQPMVEDFIRAADLSNVVPMPADLKPGTHDDVLYVAPSMPWIDMAKEATAWLTLSQAGFISEVEVIRKAGRNPDTVLEQIASWRKKVEEKELRFSSDVRHQNASGLPSPPKQNDDQANNEEEGADAAEA